MDKKKIQSIKRWLGSGSINIFGLPFAGKDTLGSHLGRTLGGPLLGGGDILRNSVVPNHVQKAMKRGELIPTKDYVKIVLPYLSREEFQGKPLILSSVGRWHGEEPSTIEATNQSDHPIKLVLYLELKERIVWQRWQKMEDQLGHKRGKRHDDAGDALEIRFNEFRVKTLPVINYYDNLGLLIKVDADRDAMELSNSLIDIIYDYSKKRVS